MRAAEVAMPDNAGRARHRYKSNAYYCVFDPSIYNSAIFNQILNILYIICINLF